MAEFNHRPSWQNVEGRYCYVIQHEELMLAQIQELSDSLHSMAPSIEVNHWYGMGCRPKILMLPKATEAKSICGDRKSGRKPVIYIVAQDVRTGWLLIANLHHTRNEAIRNVLHIDFPQIQRLHRILSVVLTHIWSKDIYKAARNFLFHQIRILHLSHSTKGI